MNANRKKRILLIQNSLEECRQNLQEIIEEEQEYSDSIPEGLVCCERHNESEDSIDNLGDAICSIGDAIDSLTCI